MNQGAYRSKILQWVSASLLLTLLLSFSQQNLVFFGYLLICVFFNKMLQAPVGIRTHLTKFD